MPPLDRNIVRKLKEEFQQSYPRILEPPKVPYSQLNDEQKRVIERVKQQDSKPDSLFFQTPVNSVAGGGKSTLISHLKYEIEKRDPHSEFIKNKTEKKFKQGGNCDI